MNLRTSRAGSLIAVALPLLGVGLAVARAGLLTEAAGVRLSAEWVMAISSARSTTPFVLP
jgi:hypothetical protein